MTSWHIKWQIQLCHMIIPQEQDNLWPSELIFNSLTTIHQPVLLFNLNTWHNDKWQIFVIRITSSLLWKNNDWDTRCTEHFTVEEWAYQSSLALSVTDWHTCRPRRFSDKPRCAGVSFRFYFLKFSLIQLELLCSTFRMWGAFRIWCWLMYVLFLVVLMRERHTEALTYWK